MGWEPERGWVYILSIYLSIIYNVVYTLKKKKGARKRLGIYFTYLSIYNVVYTLKGPGHRGS